VFRHESVQATKDAHTEILNTQVCGAQRGRVEVLKKWEGTTDEKSKMSHIAVIMNKNGNNTRVD